jgi:hypothetical protein
LARPRAIRTGGRRGGKIRRRDRWFGLETTRDFAQFKRWWHRSGKCPTGNHLGDINTFRRPVRLQPTGLSGLTEGQRRPRNTPWPGMSRPSTSFSLGSRRTRKTWMRGSSPRKGSFRNARERRISRWKSEFDSRSGGKKQHGADIDDRQAAVDIYDSSVKQGKPKA